MACVRGMSSKAATANPVTSMGSATSAFWHMAYIRAALMSHRLCSCSMSSGLIASSTIGLPSSDDARRSTTPRESGGRSRRSTSGVPPARRLPGRRGSGSVRPRDWPRRTRLLLVRGADHVLDGDASLGTRALHLGEIHSKLLSLLLGRLRGVGLLPISPGGTLSLLGGLSRGVLGLLSGASGGFLRLARRLPRGVLYSFGHLSDLAGHLPHGARGLVGNLLHGILGSSLVPAGDLLRRLSDGLGDLLHGIAQIRDLQVQDTPVGAELQGDEAAGLVLDGTRYHSLFVGGLLLDRQVGDVAHYVLVHEVA